MTQPDPAFVKVCCILLPICHSYTLEYADRIMVERAKGEAHLRTYMRNVLVIAFPIVEEVCAVLFPAKTCANLC